MIGTNGHRLGLAAAAALLLSSAPLHADVSSAQFLKLGAGGRAAALGDAFAAVSNDVTAIHSNPASIARLDAPQLALMHHSWLVDTQYQYFGAAKPMRSFNAGFSLYRLDFGDIDRYDDTNIRQGSFDAGSLAAALTLAGGAEGALRWGVTFKYLQESIESEKASAFAGDVGVQGRLGRYDWGASLQHLGSNMTFVEESAPLPFTVRVGAATRFLEDRLAVSGEVSKPNDDDPSLHAGVEYGLTDFVQLRGGYRVTPGNALDVDGLTNVTGGLGLRLGLYRLDYAFVPFGELGSTHRVSLQIEFNRFN